MRKLLLGSAVALFAATSANAASLVIDLDDIYSYARPGSASNTLLSFDIGANSLVTGIAYDVTLTAYSPSWLSELAAGFTNSSATAGISLSPGYMNSFAGTARYVDSAYLPDYGLEFSVDADGLLWVEFYESFDDSSVNPDGKWNGTLKVSYDAATVTPPIVPEPATWAMMIAGFGLVGAGMRRHNPIRAVAA